MNKYERVKQELEDNGTGSMRCFGTSMLPLIKSGSVITFIKQDDYEVGQVVFCLVNGWWVDAHLITRKDPEMGWLICSNDGWPDGWTKTIYGRAIIADFNGEITNL